MKKIVLLSLILITFIYSKDSIRPVKHQFKIGAALADENIPTAVLAYDKFLKTGTFSLGAGFRGGATFNGETILLVSSFRVGFHPLNLIKNLELTTHRVLDPYLLFTPINSMYIIKRGTDEYDYVNIPGFYAGLNITLTEHFGWWTEIGTEGPRFNVTFDDADGPLNNRMISVAAGIQFIL